MRSNRFVRLAAIAGVAAPLAACQTDGPMAAVAAPGPTPAPMTRTRAASECWMQTEQVALKISLDRRTELVYACIEKKMRGHPA